MFSAYMNEVLQQLKNRDFIKIGNRVTPASQNLFKTEPKSNHYFDCFFSLSIISIIIIA
jgi:hypothetical protein